MLSISLFVGDEIGGRGKVSGDAGPSTAGGILEGRDGSQLNRRDVLGRLGRGPLLRDVVLVGRLENHCGEGCVVGGAEGRGREEAVEYRDWKSRRSFYLTFPSQAADMRASLWTYNISDPPRGPTNTHSHTALHILRGVPNICCPL